jgi:Transposase DDE domain
MSHQAHGSDNGSREQHQDLQRALAWLLKPADFSSVQFRQDCRWSIRGLVMTAILWAWSGEKALVARFEQATKIGHRMLGELHVPTSSYQAFMKMLRTWTERLLGALSAAFRQRMETVFADRWKLAGFVVLGVDGSRFAVPHTASNEAYFSPPTRKGKGHHRKKGHRPKQSAASRAKKVNNPQMWVTTLWHLAIGLPWGWRLGPSNSSERDHLKDMLGELRDEATLLVADAGFYGYELWNAIRTSQPKHHFVIRVGSNVRLLSQLGYVRNQRGLVYCWPDRVAKESRPPLVLRLIVIQNGRHPVYLVTSVLDPQQLSDADVIRVYSLRWGIELYYRHVKQTFERTKLRSHSAEHALLEATWSLLGLWAMTTHAQFLLQSQHQDPQRLSVAHMLRAYRGVMQEYRSAPEKGQDLRSRIKRALRDNYQRTCKASRNYPRQKQRQPAGPPLITVATRAQVKQAQQIKLEIEKGLTA